MRPSAVIQSREVIDMWVDCPPVCSPGADPGLDHGDVDDGGAAAVGSGGGGGGVFTRV